MTSLLQASDYKNVIDLMNKWLPERLRLTKQSEVNTIFETYNWVQNKSTSFSEVVEMLTWDEHQLCIYYDLIDIIPELKELANKYWEKIS